MAKGLSTKLPLTANGTLPKADVLERWAALPAGKTLAMAAMPAGKTGSSYEEDSIRLTGSLKFIDSMLSNLKSLLRLDNTKTRLDVSFSQQKERAGGRPRPGKYVVYLKVVEKVRTTRAKAATPALAPARVRAAKAPVATPALPPSRAVGEALEALLVLGQKRPEAERRLALVVQAHGPGLDCAAYVTLALKVAVAKQGKEVPGGG